MICLFMTSRSGSSMTAKIFAEHGLVHNGNENYEHQGIKRWIKDIYKPNHEEVKPLSKISDVPFFHYVKGLNIDLWKGNCMYFPLWEKQQPKALFIRRNIDSIVNSVRQKNRMASSQPYEYVKSIVVKRMAYMDEVRDTYGGVDIFTDELIAGNYSSLEKAFDYCELIFNKKIAHQVIDPNKWNHHANKQAS